MATIGQHHVVVGLDPSAASRAALAWAIDEAVRRRLPLHLVSVHPDLPGVGRPLLRAAAARVRDAAPGIAVVTEDRRGPATALLVRLSAHADSLVLGSDGSGPVPGYVLRHACCPVVTVPPAPQGEPSVIPHGVVVGVDGNSASAAALAHAFMQASARRTWLEIVHAWQPPGQVSQELLAVSEVVAGWSERFSDVTVRRRLPMGPAVPALVEASRYAELLVVGGRPSEVGADGAGGRPVAGSTWLDLVGWASCPVAVVRQVSAVGTQREIVSPTSAGSTGLAR